MTALLKSMPEDFQVTEELGFEPTGEGEHLFLYVEKSGLGTMELIERIARDYSIHSRQIGYSGLKDKHATTRQWLSLHLPGQHPSARLKGDGYRILSQVRHRSKLRPGTHKSNFFQVKLREVNDVPVQSRDQIESIKKQGFANYFGRQRFGRQQDNVEQALRQLTNARLKRARKSMYLSSLRSYLFNQILSQRISLDYWQQPLEGDVYMLQGSRSIFSDKLDETLRRRHQLMDIAITASLYGSGHSLLLGKPLEIEQKVFADNREITRCLDENGSKLRMRALRVAAEDFSYDYDSPGKTLELKLRLPTGSYLTSLLDHFVTTVDAR